MGASAIVGERVSKRYEIGRARQQHDTLRDAVSDAARRSAARLGGRLRRGPTEPSDLETLWALRDVSFEIKRGDLVGIVGNNGAGKSTLLKIISRITEPTSGRVGINGRVGSLLEVGTGFHPELTGRENVFLYASILGMRQTEITRRFDEIVEFADVTRFLDTPVKRYSSGMQVRLAFAVAAYLEPDILLVDEVLAVGDAAFQKKCLGRMGESATEGRTVVFVSHNMAVMKALCKRGMVLHGGQLTYDGTIDEAISRYLGNLEQMITIPVVKRTDRTGWDMVRVRQIRIRGGQRDGDVVTTGGPATFEFELAGQLPSTSCNFIILDDLGHPVTEFNSENPAPDDVFGSDAPTRFVCEIPELPLIAGRYRIDVELHAQGHLQDRLQSAAVFDVEQGVMGGRPVSGESGRGSMAVRHRWTRTADELSDVV
jgi:lipopolysaccharide transport system ATP-binding protein